MADRWAERHRYVRARLELQGNAEIVTAVAVTVAAAVRVEVARDFFAGVREDAEVEIVAAGHPQDGATACQTIIEDTGSADPEPGEPPIAQRLQLREQLHLTVIQVTVEGVLLLGARDHRQLP